MEIREKVVVITGGASGIGAELARRCVELGAEGVVVADIDEKGLSASTAGRERSLLGVKCDVSRDEEIQALVAAALQRFGRIDIYVSNAGIIGPPGGLEIADDVWTRMWNIHVMAHVWAARAVLPGMLERGEGYFLVTASAAGLLSIVESAPYAISKHAAVAFAEWLRISHGRRGIRVSCLCPQSVATPMTAGGAGSAGVDGVMSTRQVADAVVETLREEGFLCLPHPEVLGYMQRKTSDYDRWLGGMQKMFLQHSASQA